MNRFSNIVTVQKKKTSFWISLILCIVLIIALLLMIFTPNVNIATTDTVENKLDSYKEIENVIIEEKTQEIENLTEEIIEEKNYNETINNKIIQEESITAQKNESVAVNFIKPVDGVVGAKFYNNNHTGIDIVAEDGTPIKAAASGTVIFAGYKGSYGNLVLIRHSNGTQTYYAHCSDTKVSANQTVNQGDIVATVGSTGNSTEPHLHFEIRDSGNNPIDPQNFIY